MRVFVDTDREAGNKEWMVNHGGTQDVLPSDDKQTNSMATTKDVTGKSVRVKRVRLLHNPGYFLGTLPHSVS